METLSGLISNPRARARKRRKKDLDFFGFSFDFYFQYLRNNVILEKQNRYCCIFICNFAPRL
jgi:hypothetical protein